ncbi:DUF4042 domain-containing protein [Candidatus Woesearchaeota archaeon]|nr:DUF4042 domain-containing protein [Candidatus Woesearchaeota archaeon]
MERCYSCKGKMEEGIELIIYNGKTLSQQVMKCVKCGKAVVSSEEYERIRKELHPSIINRIKSLFKNNIEFISIAKGKVL